MENSLELVSQAICRFFEKMTIVAKIDSLTVNENTINVSISTEDPQVLIGENGQTLSDLQQVLRLVLRKQIDNGFYLNLDVDGYKEKKADRIKEIVRQAIDEVIITGKEKILPVMTSQERRITHMEISSRIDVKSESVGKEPERRVVIKPV